LDLLCSARVEINLAPRVCDEAHRDEYTSWMEKKCVHEWVLAASVASDIVGFLMFDGIQVIEYVVVDKLYRRKGIGEGLVRQFLAEFNHSYLKAEARNPDSRRLLERSGFTHEGEYDHSAKFPVLVLRRGTQ
jgi:GNAT superfamily N-acetyltransferase